MFIDAKGKNCPIPVLLAKKELDAGCSDLIIAVDNSTALENLKRLASSKGMLVSADEKDGVIYVRIAAGDGKAAEASAAKAASCGVTGGYAVFFGRDCVGEGDRDLGYNLAKMAIYTLSQSEDVPAYVLFMNSGVKFAAAEEPQIIDSLNDLIAKGTEVLVCGTCLNFYGLTEKLKTGTISNMYDILGSMQRCSKVISL